MIRAARSGVRRARLTVCAALAVSVLSSGALAAATYTVAPGDTAYSIARRSGLTVDALLSLNGLTTPTLSVGQVLVVEEGAPGPVKAAPAAPAAPATYTVVAGDSLYAVARRLGTTVAALSELNGLQGSDLRVGQVLRVPAVSASAERPAPTPTPVTAASPFRTTVPDVKAPAVVPVSPAPPAQPGVSALPDPDPGEFAAVRETALNFLGVPYVLGGTTDRGLDCSGLVLRAYAAAGVNLPRTSADMYRVGQPVDRASLRPGDLVFYDTEGRGQVSHVGIYLGNEVFVHANTYSGRVTVNALSEKYYVDRYLGARRVAAPSAVR